MAGASCPSTAAGSHTHETNIVGLSPVSGFFGNPVHWTQLNGAGSAPPSAADTAIFNEAGGYTTTFTSGVGTNDLEVLAGDVTFRSLGTDRTYTLSADALLDGGHLTLGVAGDPLSLNIDENLRVQGGSLFYALHASEVHAGQLRIGASPSGNGTAAGGQMTVSNSTVGSSSTGEGYVDVQGEGSLLRATSRLTLGGRGVGELLVRSGGEVRAQRLQIATESTGNRSTVPLIWKSAACPKVAPTMWLP